MSSSTPALQPVTPPPSSPDGQHSIARQLAALQAKRQRSLPPSPVIPQPKKAYLAWTGLKGKTLWDWLQFLVQLLGALAIPLVVVLASNALTTQQQRAADALTIQQQRAADVQHQNEQAIAKDQQQEATLKAYLQRCSKVLTYEIE